MATLPLYSTPAHPDAWHRVTAPGGYEWWYFDAEDAAGDVQLVAIFLEGFVFHPEYLRRYFRYLRRPTRRRPPVPGEYPCAYLAVYEKGRVLAQFMSQYAPVAFAASCDAPDVTLGPNRLTRAADGSLRLHVRGAPWRLTWRGPQTQAALQLVADLTFRPVLHAPPHERTFLSRQLADGAEHQWVIANPLCAVEGTIRLGELTTGGRLNGQSREVRFAGRGYHDHNYGTAPIGPGLRRWMWGRVLQADRVATFHLARAVDPSLPDEVHLIEGDADGLRPVEVRRADADWKGRTPVGLAYPLRVRFGDVLGLDNPRVVDSAPFYMRLAYDATWRGERGSAFCEVAYPHRLHWPALGRMIEMSIHRV